MTEEKQETKMTEEKQETKMTEEAMTPMTQKVRSKADENVVFIGSKPFMNYVTSVVMQFTTKNHKQVIIKARGKFISRAVDVAEVASKRFLKEDNIKVIKIEIDSEEFENKEGKRVNVSTIEITLSK